MAMNRIIFGEIRDAEAAEAFIDVCSSGHPGLSTIHSRSAIDAVTRLELFLARAQPGASRTVLSEQIVTAVQVVVYLNTCQQTGQRRIMQVLEIGPISDGVVRQRQIFAYRPTAAGASWAVTSKLSAHREILEALPKRPVILSSLPSTLDLSPEHLYRGAAAGGYR